MNGSSSNMWIFTLSIICVRNTAAIPHMAYSRLPGIGCPSLLTEPYATENINPINMRMLKSVLLDDADERTSAYIAAPSIKDLSSTLAPNNHSSRKGKSGTSICQKAYSSKFSHLLHA